MRESLCEVAPAATRQDGDVEMREIETFLVPAEELHFGRTAERLYLSTSRVGQTVRAMELRVSVLIHGGDW
ncbi:helix-turn-helix domain-containing protein [Pseudonocardia sichuanensis]